MIRLGSDKSPADPVDAAARVRAWLGDRSLVLVGLMGCGKSSVGRRLATALALPFVDADDEIETAAGRTIAEIFAEHGEDFFRNGERRVIARILSGGPQVLATGGGAFMNAETRATVAKKGYSIWLRAELPVLLRRVMKRENRPLLRSGDPQTILRRLMEVRHPIYALADLHVESRDVPHEMMVSELLKRLADLSMQSASDAVSTSEPDPI